MRALNLAEDSYITNLTRVVTAVTLTEDVPAASAKRLTAACKAVRLYAEAGERSMADKVLTQITDAMGDLPVDTVRMIVKHAERLRRQWNFEPKDVKK